MSAEQLQDDRAVAGIADGIVRLARSRVKIVGIPHSACIDDTRV